MKSASAFLKDLDTYKCVLGILLRPTCVSLAVSNRYLSLAEPFGAMMLRDIQTTPLSNSSTANGLASIRTAASGTLGGPNNTATHSKSLPTRVPRQTLLRMLRHMSGELDGVVWGAEHLRHAEIMLPSSMLLSLERAQQQQQTRAVQKEIAEILENVQPGLSATWWDEWSASTPVSCRLLPEGGPAAAVAVGTPAASVAARPESIDNSTSSGSKGQPIAAAHGVTASASLDTSASSMISGEQITSAHSNDATMENNRQAPNGGSGKGGAPMCSMAALFLQHFIDCNCSPSTFG